MSSSRNGELWVILGNQLFPLERLKKSGAARVFMAEDYGLCTHFKYHKLKLVLFLTAMRRYAKAIESAGIIIHYEKLKDVSESYEKKLESYLKNNPAVVVHMYEIEDKFMESRLLAFFRAKKVELVIHESPMFLTPRALFAQYARGVSRPFMKVFYEAQRKRLGILVDKKGKPLGGKWSFDTENRAKLPRHMAPPALPKIAANNDLETVSALVESRFPNHPGTTSSFWLPTSREEAKAWLETFLKERLASFGKYEDAISQKSDFVFHSVLTPALNLGLITPDEIVSRVLQYAEKNEIPTNSLEGFIRQIIGWREFIRGIYQTYGDQEQSANFWGHHRKLTPAWYEGATGIEPLDYVIRKVVRLGYCHHIERLMVAGNLMLLCEVAPEQAYGWFMEMFVDSSDWVMVPNVFGMGIFADGGIYATKPYLCASNYLLKMSDFKRGPWCDEVDALFWSFLGKHGKFFSKNPRLNMLVKTFEKKTERDRKAIYSKADEIRERLTA